MPLEENYLEQYPHDGFSFTILIAVWILVFRKKLQPIVFAFIQSEQTLINELSLAVLCSFGSGTGIRLLTTKLCNFFILKFIEVNQS
jgi:hypothetical protein